MIELGFKHDARWEAFVILSVGDREADFVRYLIANNIPYKQLQGCCFEVPYEHYDKGVETSFFVRERDYSLIESDGWVEGQDSVLLLSGQAPHRHGRRSATLIFLDDREDRALGLWTNVTESVAKAHPYWTYDPATHEYYVTEQAPAPYEVPLNAIWEGNISDA